MVPADRGDVDSLQLPHDAHVSDALQQSGQMMAPSGNVYAVSRRVCGLPAEIIDDC